MRVFISWSGERSRQCATALAAWIPTVLPKVQPWISSASIEPGSRWNDEIVRALGELHYGIVCLTPENCSAEWVLFEAGALSKSVTDSRVVPYLLGMAPHDLHGPLAQFHAITASEEGTWKLIEGINKTLVRTADDTRELNAVFRAEWPAFERLLKSLTNDRNFRHSLEETIPRRAYNNQERIKINSASKRLAESVGFLKFRIGRNIRSRRLETSLTQEEVAELANIPSKFVGRIERGASNPSIHVLAAISEALRIPLSDLFSVRKRQMLDPPNVGS